MIVDRVAAAATLAVTSPVIVARGAKAYRRTGRVFDPVDVVGRDGHPFRLWTFAGDSRASTVLHLAAVVRGDMRFVGPRPLRVEEAAQLPADERWRLAGEPGIFSAHRLQASTGIAYDDERVVDQALIDNQSLLDAGNLGLIARSVVAGALGGTHEDWETPATFEMLGVTIANTTMADALDWIFGRTTGEPSPGRGSLLCFVNPGCLNIAVDDADYRRILHGADLVLPDGIGIKLATRMQGVGMRENVNGTDMFPRLCERAAREGTPIYLLGAREGIAEATAEAMRETYPGLVVAGTHHGYIAGHEDEVIDEINASGARILLVAMGVPQQERWLDRHRDRLSPDVLMGVGGLFDFYSGRIPRAPQWLREIGMEWSWRLVQEPRRMWRRYVIGNPLFLWRVRQEQRGRPGRRERRARHGR